MIHFSSYQQCAGKLALKKNVMIGSVCQLTWCNFSYRGHFQHERNHWKWNWTKMHKIYSCKLLRASYSTPLHQILNFLPLKHIYPIIYPLRFRLCEQLNCVPVRFPEFLPLLPGNIYKSGNKKAILAHSFSLFTSLLVTRSMGNKRVKQIKSTFSFIVISKTLA